MRIAISATGKTVADQVAEVFGRCDYFVIIETKDKQIEKTEVITNDNTGQMSGAGMATAQLMAENKIDVVVAQNIGPRALDVLKQFNIAIYQGSGIIKEVVQKYLDGQLKEIKD